MCLSIRRRRKNRNYQLNKVVVVVVVYGGLIGGKSVERERAEREETIDCVSLSTLLLAPSLLACSSSSSQVVCKSHPRTESGVCSARLSLFILPLLQADYTRLDRAGSQIDRE